MFYLQISALTYNSESVRGVIARTRTDIFGETRNANWKSYNMPIFKRGTNVH